MKSVVVFPTAFEIWQSINDINNLKNAIPVNAEIGINGAAISDIVQKYHIPYPVHIAVPPGSPRIFSEKYRTHVLAGNLPGNSFMRLSKDVYICSPEYCFVQAAGSCTLASSVRIGNDLCASYYKDYSKKYEQNRRVPITNIKRISDFVKRADGVYGISNARIAIKYVVENSFSPYESRIFAIGVLPLNHGGYGLPKPILNYHIKLPEQAARFLRRESCCVDAFWEGTMVIFEYDSNMTHLEKDQHDYDKNKVTALMDAGYKVVTGTTKHFQNFRRTEELFLLIRNNLKMRKRTERFEKYIDKRYEVFKELFR